MFEIMQIFNFRDCKYLDWKLWRRGSTSRVPTFIERLICDINKAIDDWMLLELRWLITTISEYEVRWLLWLVIIRIRGSLVIIANLAILIGQTESSIPPAWWELTVIGLYAQSYAWMHMSCMLNSQHAWLA